MNTWHFRHVETIIRQQNIIILTLVRGCLTNKKCSERGVPANKRSSPNAGSMLAHRLRRWANIDTTLGNVSCLLGTCERPAIECACMTVTSKRRTMTNIWQWEANIRQCQMNDSGWDAVPYFQSSWHSYWKPDWSLSRPIRCQITRSTTLRIGTLNTKPW